MIARAAAHAQRRMGTSDMNRRTLAEVLEYTAAAIVAVLAALMISDTIGLALWGGLTGHNFPY